MNLFRKLFGGEPQSRTIEDVRAARDAGKENMILTLRSALNAASLDLMRRSRELHLINRAIQRRNRTIARLRLQLSAEQPSELPELAKSKEGRALYNHAYNKGRIRGRKDVLEKLRPDVTDAGIEAAAEAYGDTITDGQASYDAEAKHEDGTPVAVAIPAEGIEPGASTEYGREHAH